MVLFLNWLLMWEHPAHWGWCHPRLVVTGFIRRQSVQASKQSLCISSCLMDPALRSYPDFTLQWSMTWKLEGENNPLPANRLWSWCFITIETLRHHIYYTGIVHIIHTTCHEPYTYCTPDTKPHPTPTPNACCLCSVRCSLSAGTRSDWLSPCLSRSWYTAELCPCSPNEGQVTE